MTSAPEIDRALRDLAARRASWDRTLGYCAHLVKRSGLHLVAGFASFEHYCAERLGGSRRAPSSSAPPSGGGSGKSRRFEPPGTKGSRTRR